MSLVEFDRSDIQRLLGLLDDRLVRRSMAASVYRGDLAEQATLFAAVSGPDAVPRVAPSAPAGIG